MANNSLFSVTSINDGASGVDFSFEPTNFYNAELYLKQAIDSLEEAMRIVSQIDGSADVLDTSRYNLYVSCKNKLNNIYSELEIFKKKMAGYKEQMISLDPSFESVFEYLENSSGYNSSYEMLSHDNNSENMVSQTDTYFAAVLQYDQTLEEYTKQLNDLKKKISGIKGEKTTFLSGASRASQYSPQYNDVIKEKTREYDEKIKALEEEYNSLSSAMVMIKTLRDYSLESAYNSYMLYDDFDLMSSNSRVASYYSSYSGLDGYHHDFYDMAGKKIEDFSYWEVAMYFYTSGVEVDFFQFHADVEYYYNTLKYLTDDERKILTYFINTQNNEKIDEYMNYKQDAINQRKGQELAAAVIEKIDGYYSKVGENKDFNDYFEDGLFSTLADVFSNNYTYSESDAYRDTLELLAKEGFFDGVGNFFDGFANLFGADGIVSPEQYKTSFLMQELKNRYGENTVASMFSTGTYEISNSIGNMAPSMLVGLVTGPLAGSLLMGASATGNTREQALQNGMSEIQAWLYGVLSGASETTLGYFLGGIPFLSKVDDIPGIKGFFAKMAKEGFEEFTQAILDPMFEALVTGNTADINWGDVLKSGIYGAITAGILNGGTVVISGVTCSLNGTLSSNKLAELVEKYKDKDLSNKEVAAQLINDLGGEQKSNVVNQTTINDNSTAKQYSYYDVNQIKDDCENYQELCDLLLSSADSLEVKNKLEKILYYGGYDGYSLSSNCGVRDGPYIEAQRRISMANLLLTNPDTFDVLVKNDINLFHGTNSKALENILNFGLDTFDGLQKQNIDVLTGEASTRTNGRDFISFTDVLDVAEGYSGINIDGNDLSFEVIIGTSVDAVKDNRLFIPASDVPEVGLKKGLSVDQIKVICVPTSKVDLVKSMLPNNEIQVLSIDNINNKFYYFDEGTLDFDIHQFNNMKNNNSKLELNSSIESIQAEVNKLNYNKTSIPKYISNYLASNMRKFLYKDTSAFKGLNDQIMENGLYHFTGAADAILSSGYIKSSNMNASYGTRKTFFFNGIPEVGNFAMNLDSIPIKATAVKVKATTDLVNNSKLKLRYFDDMAITYDGKFDLTGFETEKCYFGLEAEDGKLVYKQISEELYNNYENTNMGSVLSNYVSNKKNVMAIKGDFLNGISNSLKKGQLANTSDMFSNSSLLNDNSGNVSKAQFASSMIEVLESPGVTGRLIPVSTLLNIIKDNNYYSAFINNFENSKNLFGNISQLEYAMGIEQLGNAIIENQYDFGLSQEHLDRMNSIINAYDMSNNNLSSDLNNVDSSLENSSSTNDVFNGEAEEEYASSKIHVSLIDGNTGKLISVKMLLNIIKDNNYYLAFTNNFENSKKLFGSISQVEISVAMSEFGNAIIENQYDFGLSQEHLNRMNSIINSYDFYRTSDFASSTIDVALSQNATSSLIPVNTLLNIIKEDNYYMAFTNNFENNKNVFGNFSQLEYGIAIEQFLHSVIENQYDFGLDQNHLDKVNSILANYVPSHMSDSKLLEFLSDNKLPDNIYKYAVNSLSLEQFIMVAKNGKIKNIILNMSSSQAPLNYLDILDILANPKHRQGFVEALNGGYDYFGNCSNQLFLSVFHEINDALEFKGYKLNLGENCDIILDKNTLYKYETKSCSEFFENISKNGNDYGVDQAAIEKLCTYTYQGKKYNYDSMMKVIENAISKGKKIPRFTAVESAEYKLLLDKLKSKGFNRTEARIILESINDAGACSYAASCNAIFALFKDRPNYFLQKFGFSLYKTDQSGNVVLNSTDLLLDLYLFANDTSNGGKFITNNHLNSDMLNGKIDYMGNNILDSGNNQVYLSNFAEGERSYIVDEYIKSKGIGDIYSSNILYTNSSQKYQLSEMVDNVAKKIANDNVFKLGIYRSKNNVINFRSFDESKYKSISTFDWDEGDGHSVFVTDVVKEGFIVSSWGNKYLVPIEDLLNGGEFVLSDIELIGGNYGN